MAKQLLRLTVISCAAFLLSLCLTVLSAGDLWLSLAITFGTCFYHLAMRLLVGHCFDRHMHNHADYRKTWYRPRTWEKGLYDTLRVKRWKSRLPTYDPDNFDPKLHTIEELVQATCQAELVHETIALLSFLPLLAVPLFGALPVFLITSILAALFDLAFAVIQRFNRPRLLHILNRQNRQR